MRENVLQMPSFAQLPADEVYFLHRLIEYSVRPTGVLANQIKREWYRILGKYRSIPKAIKALQGETDRLNLHINVAMEVLAHVRT